MFPNPVNGIIHPKGWSRPAGNTEFVVTRTSADHVATNQGKGLDISSRRCNVDPVLAMGAGKVVLRDDTQGIIVLQHGAEWRTHYAHMRGLRYGVGAAVVLRASIGMVSDAHDPSITNFAGCHLHFGITRLINGVWVAQDPWPLLNQNIAAAGGGDPMIESLNGYADGTVIPFQHGKVYQFFGFNPTTGARYSFSWTAPATGNLNVPTEGLVDLKGEGPAYFIPSIYAGQARKNVYLPQGYATPVFPPPSGGFTQADLDKAKAEGKIQGAAENETKWEAWNDQAQAAKP